MSTDWRSDHGRTSVTFLRENHLLDRSADADLTWGFAVIRPTGAADDEQWEAATRSLREGILLPFREHDKHLQSERGGAPLDPTPTDLIAGNLELPRIASRARGWPVGSPSARATRRSVAACSACTI
ncbi:hypothetical protein RJ55_08623 [Drechmeria coniospora]|nr:hypothetical protein RJ55_08623 [Drechmeria coniospora]